MHTSTCTSTPPHTCNPRCMTSPHGACVNPHRRPHRRSLPSHVPSLPARLLWVGNAQKRGLQGEAPLGGGRRGASGGRVCFGPRPFRLFGFPVTGVGRAESFSGSFLAGATLTALRAGCPGRSCWSRGPDPGIHCLRPKGVRDEGVSAGRAGRFLPGWGSAQAPPLLRQCLAFAGLQKRHRDPALTLTRPSPVPAAVSTFPL